MYVLNKNFFKDLFKVERYSGNLPKTIIDTWYQFLWIKWGHKTKIVYGVDAVFKHGYCWNRILRNGIHIMFFRDLFFDYKLKKD